MKKFLLFAGVLYLVILVSFQEKSREPESFAKILKDQPERLQELLNVADSYKDTVKISDKILSPDDILSPKQLDIFRSKTKSRPGNRTHPVIVISTQSLNELIKNHLNRKDSIVFYLGSYSKNDAVRIHRYNERNGGGYSTKEKQPYTYKNLKKRTAFAMQVFSTVNESDQKSKSTSGIFNTRSIWGSVGKGSNDVDMNNDWTNNFKAERIAVSPVYEISRLCPPPREGCFD